MNNMVLFATFYAVILQSFVRQIRQKLSKKWFKPVICSVLMPSYMLPMFSHAIEPIGLVAVEFNHELKDSGVQGICQRFNMTCATDAKLWQLPNQQRPNHYYLIDSTPQFVELQMQDHHMTAKGVEDKDDKLLGQWQFANYLHQRVSDDNITNNIGDNIGDSIGDNTGIKTDSPLLFIAPNLYPINQTEMAIALINQIDISFDGGATRERSADFIQLLPNGKHEQVLTNVPFDGHYSYNVCFSEEEKSQSVHCQEEGWQVLNVSMKDIKTPLYQWILAYENKIWPAHTPEDKAVLETHQVKVMPFSDTATLF